MFKVLKHDSAFHKHKKMFAERYIERKWNKHFWTLTNSNTKNTNSDANANTYANSIANAGSVI